MLRKIKKQLSIAIASVFLALTFGTGMVLAQTPNPADVQNSTCQGANLKLANPGSQCTSFGTTDARVDNLIGLIINIFSIIVGVIAVIMIVYGGFRYITSGGDTAKVTASRNTILYAIIGLIIVALAQFIVKFVLTKVTAV